MENPTVEIAKVRGDADLDRFLEAGYWLRRQQPQYVPPPRRDIRVLLDRNKHPFHRHAVVEYFLAIRGGEIVGRIAAIENHAHNEFHEERIGFFGFLDAFEEPEVFAALLRAAEEWARDRGLTALRGPCSFSTNEECGLLVDGFDAPQVIMTPWNPPTWPGYIEAAGYTKAKDLYCWWVEEATYDARINRLAEKVREKLARTSEKKVVTRPLNMRDFSNELERVRKIYNTAWEKNWGFIPMTREEIDFLAKSLKPVIVPEMVQFVELDGEPVAFALSLPDYNQAVHFMEGRTGIREIGIFLLLRRRIRYLRMLTMGVVGAYRGRGLETLVVNESVKASRALGHCGAEMGWILEDNVLMNRTIQGLGARRYRTLRLYEKTLA